MGCANVVRVSQKLRTTNVLCEFRTSTWAILLSAASIVDSISLPTNGHSWQDEIPTEFVPPAPAAPFMPDATSTYLPATPPIPPAAPPTSEAP
ncbi:hypothetical protein CK203_062862 [Vitis vinifera]|uniref:Uncharacterized protein n=1 Tax=Vitis vinifera TaxID=29760 RepID=A0A438FSK3_VITVI|nr:hypothetical protein CK203_062862 [Vitis vinifera]